jgi:hypothetical protein
LPLPSGQNSNAAMPRPVANAAAIHQIAAPRPRLASPSGPTYVSSNASTGALLSNQSSSSPAWPDRRFVSAPGSGVRSIGSVCGTIGGGSGV